MKKAGLIGLAVAVLAFCIPVTMKINGYDTHSPEPFINSDGGILGQSQAEVGELVRLHVEGDDVEWTCLPESEDYEKYGKNEQNMVISFRKKGDYTIIAAILDGKAVKISKLKISVGRVVNNTDPDVPVDVDVPDTEVEIDQEIARLVAEWCESSNANKGTAAQMGDNFDAIAKEIEDGELTTTNDIIVATAEANNELSLDSFEVVMAEVQSLLTQMADSGKMSTPSAHAKVWRSIAVGLHSYSN